MRVVDMLHKSTFGIVAVAIIRLAAAGASQGATPKVDLNILYAGTPAGPRTADFAAFLARHLASVETTDLATLTEEHASRFDVVVLDHDARRPPRPKSPMVTKCLL